RADARRGPGQAPRGARPDRRLPRALQGDAGVGAAGRPSPRGLRGEVGGYFFSPSVRWSFDRSPSRTIEKTTSSPADFLPITAATSSSDLTLVPSTATTRSPTLSAAAAGPPSASSWTTSAPSSCSLMLAPSHGRLP